MKAYSGVPVDGGHWSARADEIWNSAFLMSMVPCFGICVEGKKRIRNKGVNSNAHSRVLH